jgi:hypothetical protein
LKLFKFELVTFYGRNKFPDTHWDKSLANRRPVFPVDTEKPQETAVSWASNNQGDAEWVVDVNNSFSELQIIGVEHRGNGGRAYKVALTVEEEDIVVEIRDKVFEHFLLSGKIDKGKLSGTWKFINDRGSSLVPVNSHWAIDYDKIHGAVEKKKLKKSEIKPMEVYKTIADLQSPNPSFSIYLGEVWKAEIQDGTSFRNLSLKPVKNYLFYNIHVYTWRDVITNPNPNDYGRVESYKSMRSNLYKDPLTPEEKAMFNKFKSLGITMFSKKNYMYNNSIFRNTARECLQSIGEINNLANISMLGHSYGRWQRSNLKKVNPETLVAYTEGEKTSGNLTTTDLCSTWV